MDSAKGLARILAAALVVSLAGASLVVVTPAGARGRVALVGTFKITGGICNPVTKTVTGSYFRLIFPKGGVFAGPFFQNSTSSCYDKSYTTVSPGSQGGLVTGAFQPGPRPAFALNGDARARRVIHPVPFAAIDLSLSTQSPEPQTGRAVPAPSIAVSGSTLSGNVQAVSMAWKHIFINQGSPKPGGRRPGITIPLSGRFNARTRAFAMNWTSQIVGGPFTGFVGQWHLVGKFAPAR